MNTNRQKEYTLKELTDLLAVQLKGDPDRIVRGIAPLADATGDQISFLTNKRYAHLLNQSQAAAVIVDPSHAELDRSLLISPHPYVTMARAAQLFAPEPAIAPGVSPLAFVDESVEMSDDVAIGPLVHIGSQTSIGTATKIYGGTYIGRNVRIGKDCLIYPNVTILDGCVVGNRVIIHAGTVVGSDGFGFAQDEAGRHIKIPQVGIVQIDDDVEIGANCTIDRATFGRTWIQKGCKIDNLVQIAHNVTVGEHTILVAQVGIAGSTSLGRHVVLGGQVGVAGHIEIVDGVRVGATSAVAHSVKERQDLLGSPAVNAREWIKTYTHIQRLPKFKEEVKNLRRKVAELEKTIAALSKSL